MRRPLIFSLLATLLLVSACGFDDPATSVSDAATNAAPDTPDTPNSSAEGPPDDVAEGEILRVALAFAPDAGFAIDTDDASVLTSIGAGEPLTRVGSDGVLQPSLAVSWEQTDDTTWRFELRPDVTFHDGAELTAEAVVGSIEYLFGSPTPPRGIDPASLSVSAVNDLVVEFTTTEPDPILPGRLSAPSTSILSPDAYGDGQPEVFGTGTGPFVLVDQVPAQSVTVTRFDDYWGGPAALAGAEVSFIPEADVRAAALRSGDVDLAETLSISQVPVLEDTPGIEVVTRTVPRASTVYTNTQKPPLDDVRVRAAVRAAIDRDAIAAGVLEGAATPATGLFAPSEPFGRSFADVGYDPERARALLAEAGIAEGELTLKLWTYSERAELPDLASVVQAQLAEVGIATDIEVTEYAALEPRVLAGEHDLFVLSRSYRVDANDPGPFLESDYTCEGSFNLNAFCDPDLDAIVAQLASTADPEERLQLVGEAEALLVDSVAGVTLSYDELRAGIADGVTGYELFSDSYVLTTQLDIAR